MDKFFNFLMFQFGWFGCVLGASYHKPWVGPMLVVLLVGIHFKMTATRQKDLITVLIVTLIGIICESLFMHMNAFQFVTVDPGNPFPPLFMIAFWPNFAISMHSSLGWLEEKPLLAVILGMIGAPMAYYGGEKLGAIVLNDSWIQGLGLIGITWGIVLPLAYYLEHQISQKLFDKPVSDKETARTKQDKATN